MKRYYRKFLAAFLSFAMVFSMLPLQAFAAENETAAVDTIVFKNMQLYSAVNHRPISTYFNADKENYYQTPTTLGSGENQPLEWMLLSYAIQLTQPVNLTLYKLSDDYADSDDNPIIFEPDENPDAQEEFLDGECIGYLAGIRMTDNVEPDLSKGEGYYKYIEIDNDIFCEMLVDHINNATELTVMKDVIVYGFDGEPLIVQRPVEESLFSTDSIAIAENEALALSVDESSNAGAPETEPDGADATANPDATPDCEPEYDSAISNDASVSATNDELDAEESSLDNLDENLSVAENADAAEDKPFVEDDTSMDEEPLVDVEPNIEEARVDAVAENGELPQTEGKIQNYLIWNGMLASEDGTPISYNYTDGKYIIVLEPTTEETKQYNSFLAFSVSTTARPNQLLAEEYPGLYYEFPGDPVNLLTGSFSWSYTDMMMYGKYNLPFIRYYESTDADRNYGLGYGWSSDYSVELELDTLYAKVTLPGGKDIYFDYYYDGSYRAQAGSAFTFKQVGSGYQLANDDGTVYLFDADKNIRSVSTLDGNVITYTYSGGRLASVSNSSGTLSFDYNGDGNLKSVTDSVGRTVKLSYSGDYLISAENADGDNLLFDYDASGCLTRITNFNGDVYLTNSYDGSGRVVSQYVQDEGNFRFTYDDHARQNTCTGENGYYLSIVYDELGRIIQSTNSEGTKYISYNSLNQRISETDREGNTTEYAYDANGNVILVTYADGLSESYTYNTVNQITSFTDRGGNRVSYVYDDDANLVSMTDARGNTVSYTYDGNHNAISYTDALGGVTRYTYDAAGNRTSATDPVGNVTTYTYDSQGRCVSVTDAAGSVTNYEYTDAGKLVKTINVNGDEKTFTVDGNGFNLTESDWLGNVTAFTYNTQNSVTSVTDPLGNVTRYDYDASGNMSVSTDANGHTTSYTYDAEGRMVSMTNASGKTWSYTYDRNGNLLTITDPLGGKTSTAYNSMQQQTSVTDENGGRTSYSYDAVGNILSTTDALNKTTTYTYDANGNLTSETDRRGNTTTFTYDAENRLVSSTNALNGTTTYVYDEIGSLLSVRSPAGNTVSYDYDEIYRNTSLTNARGIVTSYDYDALGRKTAAHYADGSSVGYTYDANGHVLTATDELDGITTYTYDTNGQLLTMTDPMGGTVSYTYDAVGNVISVTDTMGFVTAYTYTDNDSIATVTDAEGYVTSYTYDALDRVTTITSPNGNTESFAYDAKGNTISSTDAAGNTITFTYDALDRLTSMTDANGGRWVYAYDNEGNMTGTTDALGYSYSRSYDALGQLVSETDRNGNIRRYSYDADGNLTSYTDPLGNTVSYAYDANGNLISETSAMGNVNRYTYDSRDRLKTSSDPMEHVVTFFYDAKGQLTGLTNKDGTSVSYTYDANGNNLTVTDEEGFVVTYTYDANGRMTALKNARGYTTAYEYDKVGNLIKTTNALGGITSCVYDGDGNLISETNTDGATTSYSYDSVGRVISITDGTGAVTTAEYDGNGNIVKITQADDSEITYTYDANDQLISYVDAAGYTHSFTYDGNGNVTSETDGNGNTTQYSYDALDRPSSRTDAEGGVASRTYDADGRLIKTVNEEGAETVYAYDACGRVVSMTDALGGVTSYTYDEMDRVLTVTDARGGITTYTYTDRGDVATVTDAEGYVVSYEYDGNRNCVKMTTVDGDTLYEYDALDRLIGITTPDGKSEAFTYNGEGQITSSTDKGGHTTSYELDANGNITKTTDALGNDALFEYDEMGNLVKVSLHRVDTQDNVDEWEITLYSYDGRGLVTQEVNALGAVTTYAYDGNGNLVTKTDADGYVTSNTYTKLDMVSSINYNGGKEVSYHYNAVGDLVQMTDWTGTTAFEVDLLRRITKTTDTKGNTVEYSYDAVGNQTGIHYPDDTTVTKTYDLLGQLKTVTEDDGRTTTYTYDGMGRLSRMEYPHGWVEEYHYDAIGQLTSVEDTDPTRQNMKQQKHVYRYDDCGNMVYEYMRGNGTGEATVENTYAYDALHRVISAHEDYGNKTRTYTYDSLGNLTYETEQGNKSVDYRLNNLNQITESSDDGWKTSTAYTYDLRGNLTQETYTKNKKVSVVGAYIYDETNKMVSGTNENGEVSNYIYNGLGALVENQWIITKNGYGYHDVDAGNAVVTYPATGLHNSSTVIKQFIVDYTSETFEPLMEHEINGFDYRYVYGNDRLSVDIKGVTTSSGNLIENGDHIRLYYHMDYLGTADYLTSPVSGKITSWTHYNEWGEITHNAVLKCGQRELDMVKRYATHDFDSVLGQYYAKARFYDAGSRHFTAMDPIKDGLNWYSYCENNPVIFLDYMGTMSLTINGEYNRYYSSQITTVQTMLEYLGYLDMGIDDKGNKQAYGTYGGRTAGAIRLFKFNYGMNWSDSSAGDTNDSDYLTILNVYVNKRYSNSSTEVRKAIYNNYVNLLKASNTRLSDETGTYVPRYYKNFMSCIQKNAVLPEQYSKMGTRIKIDYSTNDYVRRLDFTTAIDAMISRNAQACLNHRFASYEELWNEYMALPWYFRMFIDAQSIYDQYQAGFVSTATWFISKDGSEKEWDIKRSNRFAEQIGGPWLGIHVDFFWGEEVLNAEELGNWAFGYWASACGFDRKTIVAGSALENFGDNLLKLKWVTSENPNDIKYYNEGIAQFIREHPELSR